MALPVAELAVIGGAAVALSAGAGSALLSRRATIRRLTSVTARLHEDGAGLEGRGRLESRLAALEQAAEHAVSALGEARRARDRMGQALRLVPAGVVVADESGEIVLSNPQADAVLGARGADVLAQRTLTRLLEAALEGRADRQTVELQGPPRRTLVLAAAPVEGSWPDGGAVAVIEDASERRQLQTVRRDFVANVGQRLRTPVVALDLLAETLAAEGDRAVARRLAARLQVEARDLGRVLDELLDLARAEIGEAPVREPVPVHLLLAEAAERIRPVAERMGVTVEVTEAPRRLRVAGDRPQLVSALGHLLDNAVKVSPAGSTVTVRPRTDGEWVEVAVRDPGPGIPTRELERVFERFYRLERGRARDAGGAGLGLSIARHVARGHEGEVVVESTEGEGSTFVLRLPAGAGPVAVRAAQAG